MSSNRSESNARLSAKEIKQVVVKARDVFGMRKNSPAQEIRGAVRLGILALRNATNPMQVEACVRAFRADLKKVTASRSRAVSNGKSATLPAVSDSNVPNLAEQFPAVAATPEIVIKGDRKQGAAVVAAVGSLDMDDIPDTPSFEDEPILSSSGSVAAYVEPPDVAHEEPEPARVVDRLDISSLELSADAERAIAASLAFARNAGVLNAGVVHRSCQNVFISYQIDAADFDRVVQQLCTELKDLFIESEGAEPAGVLTMQKTADVIPHTPLSDLERELLYPSVNGSSMEKDGGADAFFWADSETTNALQVPNGDASLNPVNFSTLSEVLASGVALEDIHLEDYEIDPRKPTISPPGKFLKVLTMEARYEAGIPLWHDKDPYSQESLLTGLENLGRKMQRGRQSAQSS